MDIEYLCITISKVYVLYIICTVRYVMENIITRFIYIYIYIICICSYSINDFIFIAFQNKVL